MCLKLLIVSIFLFLTRFYISVLFICLFVVIFGGLCSLGRILSDVYSPVYSPCHTFCAAKLLQKIDICKCSRVFYQKMCFLYAKICILKKHPPVEGVSPRLRHRFYPPATIILDYALDKERQPRFYGSPHRRFSVSRPPSSCGHSPSRPPLCLLRPNCIRT